MVSRFRKSVAGVTLAALLIAPSAVMAQGKVPRVTPSTMKRVGQVDEHYQSYNIEMLEVTGGKFWKPYKDIKPQAASDGGAASSAGSGGAPAGLSADLYQYRAPVDLANKRLRAMAAALGPAYVRMSGTWANTTFFADTDTPPKDPPKGYDGVLTRQQWLGAIAFSRAVDAPIVTSMPLSDGTRDANELWRPDQARKWLAFTEKHGGTIAAAEYFNEPTLASMGGAPKGYDPAAFGRDFRVYQAFMRREYPGVKLLGPGSVGEADAPWAVAMGGYGDMKVLPADELARYTGDADAFSYHHYGAASQRCAAMGHQTTEDQALSEEWLGRTDATLAYYRQVRDKAMPGKHFWNTETADAACGGNPWGATFIDSFRYLDQLGRLAKQQVDVVFHNTLIASDYGLLDENTFEPKPNYWAALLWRRYMGTTVLDTGVTNGPGLHVYAHCMRGVPRGVAMLVINTDRQASHSLTIPVPANRYTLTAASLTDKQVMLNGKVLALGPDDAFPMMAGRVTAIGPQAFAPVSISFLALPFAKNVACH